MTIVVSQKNQSGGGDQPIYTPEFEQIALYTSTTDSTPTKIYSFSVIDTVLFRGMISAKRTDIIGLTASFKFDGHAQNTDNVFVVCPVSSINKDNANYNCYSVVNTETHEVEIYVVGDAAQNISWSGVIEKKGN